MHTYRQVLILGYGGSGRAAEALLRSEGALVKVISQEMTPDYTYESLPFEPDVAIVSPGFSLEHPWVKDLVARGIPLLSELELGWSRRRCPVIAVTGSNGKSTVVKWIADALTQAGHPAIPCGNYGLPVSAAVMQPDTPEWLVIEVSSFQLETIDLFRPEIGVLLNVLPNHLDRHGDLETYRAFKFRLFENMTAEDIAIVAASLLEDTQRTVKACAVTKTFGTEKGTDYCFKEGRVGPLDVSGTYFDNEILGAAVAAVAAVADACDLPLESLATTARDFEPLPHRMQLVAKINGVRFINDSKATNLAGMCAALRMTSGRIHLIAGGRAKESDLSFVKDLLAQRVSQLYLIGEASSAMQSAWGDDVSCFLCETLDKAVLMAGKSAMPGETVLLSPACTSFDQFRSFAERGEAFVREVNRLVELDAGA